MSKRRSKHGPRRVGAEVVAQERVASKGDGDWYFRPITGATSTKSYRCPGCDHLIRPATPHTVVWPTERPLLSNAAIDERRHWHTHCWRRKV